MKYNEKELDEFESTKYFIKYLITKPDVEDYELYDGLMRLNEIGKKVIDREDTSKEEKSEIDSIMDLDDMKELVDMFFSRFQKILLSHQE